MYYSEKYLNEFEFRKTKLFKTAKIGTNLISDVTTRKIKHFKQKRKIKELENKLKNTVDPKEKEKIREELEIEKKKPYAKSWIH